MTKTFLLAGAAALALTGGASAAVSQKAATGARAPASNHVIHAPKNMATLYDQNIADGAYGFFSQTLSSYPQYDEYLADDFKVPAGHTWKVKEVDVTGFYYIEAGPASSVNVLFWKNKKGLPSSGNGPLVECDNINPADGLSTGAFHLKLPKSCKVALNGGKGGKSYWVTVQANMQGPFTSGYWAWNTNNEINGNQGAGWWYGGSVGVNDPQCLVQFETMSDCTGLTVDFAYALLGKDV